MGVFRSLSSALASLCLIFGGLVPYIGQYRALGVAATPARRLRVGLDGGGPAPAAGFSHFVCFILLVANITRIFYWFEARFELPLLYQSLLMIVAQLLLLYRCVLAGPAAPTAVRIRDLRWRDIWSWTMFEDYVVFLFAYSLVLAVLGVAFSRQAWYGNTLGFLSLVVEATLGWPQVYRNWRAGSAAGVSVSMVLGWAAGDVFKVVYFSLRRVPVQFLVCAALQLGVDAAVGAQMVLYASKKGSEAVYAPVGTEEEGGGSPGSVASSSSARAMVHFKPGSPEPAPRHAGETPAA